MRRPSIKQHAAPGPTQIFRQQRLHRPEPVCCWGVQRSGPSRCAGGCWGYSDPARACSLSFVKGSANPPGQQTHLFIAVLSLVLVPITTVAICNCFGSTYRLSILSSRRVGQSDRSLPFRRAQGPRPGNRCALPIRGRSANPGLHFSHCLFACLDQKTGQRPKLW